MRPCARLYLMRCCPRNTLTHAARSVDAETESDFAISARNTFVGSEQIFAFFKRFAGRRVGGDALVHVDALPTHIAVSVPFVTFLTTQTDVSTNRVDAFLAPANASPNRAFVRVHAGFERIVDLEAGPTFAQVRARDVRTFRLARTFVNAVFAFVNVLADSVAIWCVTVEANVQAFAAKRSL